MSEQRGVSDKLAALIERIRAIDMSAEDKEKQRRSFAYGNTKIENDRITREMVDSVADDLGRERHDG